MTFIGTDGTFDPSTLPVIGAANGDITPVFYQRMFAAHPELERDRVHLGVSEWSESLSR